MIRGSGGADSELFIFENNMFPIVRLKTKHVLLGGFIAALLAFPIIAMMWFGINDVKADGSSRRASCWAYSCQDVKYGIQHALREVVIRVKKDQLTGETVIRFERVK